MILFMKKIEPTSRLKSNYFYETRTRKNLGILEKYKKIGY